jgi:hypothetical protein
VLEKKMLQPSHFEEQARTIVRTGEKRGIVIRVIGATAVRLHCPKFKELHTQLGRELSVLDFVVKGKNINEIAQMFETVGYQKDPRMQMFYVYQRGIFQHPQTKLVAEVFLDKLSMWHTIELADRLELDSPTISLADLVLEKTQIVKIQDDDLKDIAILFLEHDIGEGEAETIDSRYIRTLLSKDWGFWYTVTTNLNKTKDNLTRYNAIDASQRDQISARIDRLLTFIELEPKSTSWKMRASIGPRRIWYNEVE